MLKRVKRKRALDRVVNVSVLKAGCIATLPLVEFLLDERAERKDIDVRVVGSGAKLGLKQCRETAEFVASKRPDIAILIGPAQSAPGPKEARRILTEAGVPTVVISDGPTKKIVEELEMDGFGYIIVMGDPMIGARREFLDPTEMALYNAHAIKVLATTGTFKVVVRAIDDLIQAVKRGEKPVPPKIIIDKETAAMAANFDNPYAKSKAMAAYEIACGVADLTVEGCFVEKDWKRYTQIVASAHEMMRQAAKLCDEAVEMEKAKDAVARSPHHPNGTLLFKRSLIEKPSEAQG